MSHRPAQAALPALVALLALGACRQGGDVAAADSTLARDLTLAATSRATARDSFADTAITTHPVPAPAPSPAPRLAAAPTPHPAPRPTTPPAAAPVQTPAPRVDSALTPAPVASSAAAPAPTGAGHSIGAGTGMAMTMQQTVCSQSSKPGDRFIATLSGPVASPDGGSLPAGTDVVLELASVIPVTGQRGRVEFLARGIAIDGYIRPIDAEVQWVDATLESHDLPRAPGTSSDAGKVGRGAMTGAILGRVFGGGAKGTVIGAAAGAAAGAATAKGGHQKEGCLPKGSVVHLRLTGPLTIGD